MVLALVGSTLIVYGDETAAEGDRPAVKQQEALADAGPAPAQR
jgi:hypothetical protein